MTSPDEQAFLLHLAAHPEDENCRLVYADWLDENGRGEEAAKQRVMGPGYRALKRHDKYPRTFNKLHYYWACNGDLSHMLPPDWFWYLSGPKEGKGDMALWPENSSLHNGCFSPMDAAALAFAKLSPERQAELLAYQTTGAAT